MPPEKADGVFEVPDAEAQESYIFNKFGQHVITKDLMTGITKFKMSYTQTTSTGKELQTQIFICLRSENFLNLTSPRIRDDHRNKVGLKCHLIHAPDSTEVVLMRQFDHLFSNHFLCRENEAICSD